MWDGLETNLARIERSVGRIDPPDDDELASASHVTSMDFIQDAFEDSTRLSTSNRLSKSSAHTKSLEKSNEGVLWSSDRSNSSKPTGWPDYEYFGANRAQGSLSSQHPPYTANNDFNEDEVDNVYRASTLAAGHPTVPENEYYMTLNRHFNMRNLSSSQSSDSRTQVSTSSRLTDTSQSHPAKSQSSCVTQSS